MPTRSARYDSTGLVCVVLTLLGWSSVLLFLKYLSPYIDAWTANGWRYGISALLWLPVLVAGVRRGDLPPGLWRRAVVPALVNCAGQVLFASAPYYIGPGLTGFLLRVALISSTLGAFILFADERVLARAGLFWIGMSFVAAGSVGTVLLGDAPLHGANAVGIALGLGAGALFGLYGVSVRYFMQGIPAMTSFAVIALYTAGVLLGLMALVGRNHGLDALHLSGFNWFIVVVSSLIGIALGHVWYYTAIARLGVAVASAVVQLSPFLCAIGSLLIFKEKLTAGQWTAGFIMLVGASCLLIAEQRRRTVAQAKPNLT